MHRRTFMGLGLAAVGGVFVPEFGRWYQAGRGLRGVRGQHLFLDEYNQPEYYLELWTPDRCLTRVPAIHDAQQHTFTIPSPLGPLPDQAFYLIRPTSTLLQPVRCWQAHLTILQNPDGSHPRLAGVLEPEMLSRMQVFRS